jgi:hypothetical protein
MKKILTSIFLTIASAAMIFAGNPDRQGEAGAYELLMNPWARSAGFHTLNTSFVSGVEAMRLNVAGLTRIGSTEFNVGYTQYLKGTTVNLNSLGIAQKVGTNGTFGLSVMNVDFGDIDVTTTANPEGTGSTFSPTFFNLGVSYAHLFENKISVGITARVVSESIQNVGAVAAAFDAGVQYVSGENDNFKFGISLRNIGTKMKYSGDGLSFQTPSPDETEPTNITVNQRAQGFELPSVLNMGISYDLYLGKIHRLTPLANFTANSFSRDDIGAGLEYSYNDILQLRGAYRYPIGDIDEDNPDFGGVYDGLALGASLQVPLKKGSDKTFSVDYAFRSTTPFEGTHNFGVRLNL